jgi:hypothetical protein
MAVRAVAGVRAPVIEGGDGACTAGERDLGSPSRRVTEEEEAVKRLALLAALTFVATGVAAVFAAGAGARQTTEETLKFYESEKGSTFRFVDNPPKSRRRGEPTVSAGDFFVIFQPLETKSRQRIGKLHVACFAIRGSRRFERATFLCHGRIRLAGGTVTLEGVVRLTGGLIRVAITGGTGTHEGAGGAFTSQDTRGRSVDTLHLVP